MQLSMPVGLALVMAPTSAGRSDTSLLGRAFLTVEDPAGLMAYVLVLCPRLYRFIAELTQQQFGGTTGKTATGRTRAAFFAPALRT
jgi:hypothetical protein